MAYGKGQVFATPDRGNSPMSELLRHSETHRRTRRDHKSETAEDYVEAVADIQRGGGECRIRDLAVRFGVSHVTVNRIVERLCREGLLRTMPYRPVELTARGKRLAARCRRRHEIVFRFLVAIGVDSKVAATDAEGIEHHVSDSTLRQFQRWIEENAVSREP
jgi:DtxR family manganese transport transcriptional regulator